jgi:hypothetical protein
MKKTKPAKVMHAVVAVGGCSAIAASQQVRRCSMYHNEQQLERRVEIHTRDRRSQKRKACLPSITFLTRIHQFWAAARVVTRHPITSSHNTKSKYNAKTGKKPGKITMRTMGTSSLKQKGIGFTRSGTTGRP